jgi:hypothetical protein
MTTFDDRERAAEAKFAHDEEFQFRANARRNKLLGLWAAELLGRKGEAAQAYALEVVKADFEGKASADEIRARMDTLLAVARQQLISEA